jgi:hypothetical protein
MADQDETSLRDDLEESIEKVEPEETTKDEVETAAETETTEETQTEVSGEVAETPETTTEPVVAETTTQPPVDWAANVKEQWKDLPPEVQGQIAQREAHINEKLRETAGIRQEYDSFSEMISPYIPLMQAEGAQNPQEAVQGLLNTTATLSMGNPQQKAQKIAAMIGNYGVDIELLDGLLAGNAPAQPAAPPSDPRIDAIWQRMQQAEQNSNQQMQGEAATSISEFAAKPENIHFQSVKNVMADFIDMAGTHGQDMTLEEAYQRACLSDPNIAPLVTAQFANNNSGTNAVAAAQAAAGSIAGKPAAGSHTGLKEDMTLRESIEAQFGSGDRI